MTHPSTARSAAIKPPSDNCRGPALPQSAVLSNMAAAEQEPIRRTRSTEPPSSSRKDHITTSPTPLPPQAGMASPAEKTASGALTALPASKMALKDPQPRCLFFDVFGTCVDWRETITQALWDEARAALNSPAASLASRIRIKASDMTFGEWGEVAQEWRNSYLTFTRSLAADPTQPYKTVDQHHLDSLRSIMTTRGLLFPRTDDTPSDLVHDGSLWDEQQLQDLTMMWHKLTPWPDTCRGIRELNRLFWTCTLTNGNLDLITEMVRRGGMEFTHVFSAEMFRSYKPNARVYLGAAEKLGLRAEECVMVAAHLDDLRAAKGCGFRTVYVERPREERRQEWVESGKAKGWVDVWVEMGEEGFVSVAERLGVQVLKQRQRSSSGPVAG